MGSRLAAFSKGAILLSAALLALASGVCAWPAQGDSAALLAAQGQAAYEQGRFEEATQLYQRLASGGGEGGEVRYNLGNCYLRSGDLGRAILEYRRALQFSPDLSPAKKNLAVARRLLPGRVAPWQPSPWETFIASVPIPLLQWCLLALALLGNGALALVLLSSPGRVRRTAAGASVGAFAAALLCGGALSYAATVLPTHRPAVVLAPAPVFASPEGTGAPLATLPAGSEIILTARAGDRALVMWGEGRGWTSASSVEAP